MDPVDIHVSVYLDRVVDEGAEIDFGRVAERAGTEGRIAVFGGALSIDDMEAAWLPKTNVLAATDTGIVGNCNKITVQTAFTTGLIVTHEVAPAADYSGYEAIGFLIKSDTDIAAGALQIGWDEGSTDMSDDPQYLDLPALEAGKWYWITLAFTGTVEERDAVQSLGFNVVSDLSTTADVVLHVDEVRAGALSNGIAGIVIQDEAKQNDKAEQYEAALLGARGKMRGTLQAGVTVVSEQRLYPVPGTGELTTTEINVEGPEIRAEGDNSDAGTQTPVIIG